MRNAEGVAFPWRSHARDDPALLREFTPGPEPSVPEECEFSSRIPGRNSTRPGTSSRVSSQSHRTMSRTKWDSPLQKPRNPPCRIRRRIQEGAAPLRYDENTHFGRAVDPDGQREFDVRGSARTCFQGHVRRWCTPKLAEKIVKCLTNVCLANNGNVM